MAPSGSKSLRLGRPSHSRAELKGEKLKDKPSPLRIIKRYQSYSRPLAKTWSSTDEEGSPPHGHGDHLPLRVMRKRASTIFGEMPCERDDIRLASDSPTHRPWNLDALSQEAGTGNGTTTSQASTLRQRFSRIPKARKVSILMKEFFETPEEDKAPSRSGRRDRRGTRGKEPSASPDHGSATDGNDQSVYSCPEFSFSGPSRSGPRSPSVRGGAPAMYSWVLVPNITITPNSTCLFDGQQSLWAAVEISSQLSHASMGIEGGHVQRGQRSFHEAGCLYDMTVDIRPTAGTRISQMIRRQEFPATIYLGQTILLVVRINIDVGKVLPPPKRLGHVRQRSDELFADLEMQLGDSQVDYMEVHLSYSHSAFQDHSSPDAGSGVSDMCSKVHTKAVATLKRHNAESPWSQHPASVTHKLFQLMEHHWGVERASEAIQRISSSYSTRAKVARITTEPEKGYHSDGSSTRVGSGGSTSPIIAFEQASLSSDGPSSTLESPWADKQLEGSPTSTSSMTTLQPQSMRKGAAAVDGEGHVAETAKRTFSRSSKRGEDKVSSLWKRWSSYLP